MKTYFVVLSTQKSKFYRSNNDNAVWKRSSWDAMLFTIDEACEEIKYWENSFKNTLIPDGMIIGIEFK